jgi:hypothetical protein
MRARRTFWGQALWMVGAGAGLSGCDSAEVKACRSQYLDVYAQVSAVDTTEQKSIEDALQRVTDTLALCERAGLAEEKKQLTVAQRKLESHADFHRRQATQKKLTPEQLQLLVKQGDPDCPKGQSYMYQKSGSKVRCTGPQIVDMNWQQVHAYFGQRGFKLHQEGATFKAELGSESYTYSFSKAGDASPAKCLVVFAAPQIPWEETASRVTGELPRRIKRDEPVKTAHGPRALKVEEDAVQAVVRLGDCGV